MEFHGFLGNLGNSDRNAHDTDAMENTNTILYCRDINELLKHFVISI